MRVGSGWSTFEIRPLIVAILVVLCRAGKCVSDHGDHDHDNDDDHYDDVNQLVCRARRCECEGQKGL